MRTLLAGLALLGLTTTPSAEAITIEMTRTFAEGAVFEDDEFGDGSGLVRITRDLSIVTAIAEIPPGSLSSGAIDVPFVDFDDIIGENTVAAQPDGTLTGRISQGLFGRLLCFGVGFQAGGDCPDGGFDVFADILGWPDAIQHTPHTWLAFEFDGGPLQRHLQFGTYQLIAQVPAPPTSALLLAGAAFGVGLLRLARVAQSRT